MCKPQMNTLTYKTLISPYQALLLLINVNCPQECKCSVVYLKI